MRVLGSLGVAIVIAMGLFYLMHYMITGTAKVVKPDDYMAVDFVRLKNEREAETRTRELPKKPQPPKKPPTPKKMTLAQSKKPLSPELKMDMPDLKGFKLGGGPFLGGPVSSDTDIIPLVRIAPQYPRKAAMAGVEGWVEVEFTITENGLVQNPRVVRAEPRRMFDSAAIRAILKWRFKPMVVDGKQVERQATQTITFKLSSQ